MRPTPTLHKQETEGYGNGSPHARLPRVLIIAEAANPALTSAALVAWSASKALLDALPEAHLVTELRNRENILATGLDPARVTFIDARALQHTTWRIATWLRGGKDLGWTTYAAFTALVYPFFERAIWRQFKTRLRQGEFDVVHRVHPLSPMTPSWLAKKLQRIGVPFVLGPLNGGVPWPREFAYLRKKEGEWMGRFRSLPKYLPAYRSTRANASAILCASTIVWNEIPARYHAKCIYLPENAIDPQRFPITPRPSPVRPIRAAFVGRLVPLKGVDMLIEAAAPLVRAGQLELDIIGDGPERATLEELTAQYGIGQGIRFHGWVAHEQVGGLLRSAHVFAFPSVREFGGGVVLEAMAMGLVPVVLDWGGPPELVPHQCGLLVPMASRERVTQELRMRLEQLCREPALIASMSKHAQHHVHTLFTWSAKATQMLEVYRWVTGQRASKPDWGMPIAYAGDGLAERTAARAQEVVA
ncbi:MAG: glycosyltransferase family 4 protein [Roseimicrobium sp.]